MDLTDMIGRHSNLKVSYGAEGTPIENGHVYLAPPECHLMIKPAGLIHLDNGPPEHFHRPAADVLFRSAAKIYGPRVIALVLTGGDADGARGCKAVKDASGTVVVQEPADAKDPSMPLNAIRSERADYRSTLEHMRPLLIELVDAGFLR